MENEKIVTYGTTKKIKLSGGTTAQVIVDVKVIDAKTGELLSFTLPEDRNDVFYDVYKIMKNRAKETRDSMSMLIYMAHDS